MAKLLDLWNRLRPHAGNPSGEPRVGIAATEPTASPGTAAGIANLPPEAIRITRMGLDNRLREVAEALDDHRVEMRSLIDAYSIADGDDARRRILARQYQYLERRGHQLEERHDDLLLLSRQWDTIALQQEKETWQQEDLRAAARVADAASLHEMVMLSIARSESWREDVQATVDAADIATDKAKARRDFGLQATLTTLDEMAERQRAAMATARQEHLSGVADGLDALLRQSLDTAGQPARPVSAAGDAA